MSTNQDLIQVEINMKEEVAHIKCPYCLKASSVCLSYSDSSNKPWWNTSNFDRHVQQIHEDFPNVETDCEYDSHKKFFYKGTSDEVKIIHPLFRVRYHPNLEKAFIPNVPN